MRFNLRLHGRSGDGRPCTADITVYAQSSADLQEQAKDAALDAAWCFDAPPHDAVPEGSAITVERVEKGK